VVRATPIGALANALRRSAGGNAFITSTTLTSFPRVHLAGRIPRSAHKASWNRSGSP
jgi:hypothetical protein